MDARQFAYLGGAPPEMRFAQFAAREAFFAAVLRPPTAAENALLRRLLRAADDFCENAANAELIIPRPGALSPWSSKAGGILRNCGLDFVLRLERGVLICGGGGAAKIADRMTQIVLHPPDLGEWRRLFKTPVRRRAEMIAATADSIRKINEERGWALSAEEIAHLCELYARLNRAPSEAELMMFAQANSEHCRHKIFRAAPKNGGDSLMDLIRRTHDSSPDGVLTAFADNAAVIRAAAGEDFAPGEDGVWRKGGGLLLVAKAETHNHPTAISPFPGAATGSGGEIRDEAAAGRGAASRAGFAGFAVSHLRIPEQSSPARFAPSPHLASALDIMIEAPLGAAGYCNEFGRPSLGGFFRSLESEVGGRKIGFHKPVMLAGGLGQMRAESVGKKPIPPGAKIVQLGGPGFRIGVGGGAASSRDGGEDDFSSVQRDNAEMQRRAQEVIDICRRAPGGGMLLSLHDVGAGGIANATAEMAYDAGVGARVRLSAVPVEDKSMSAAEIWCNESQERYMLALSAENMDAFAAICARENCPFAVIGEAEDGGRIVLQDEDGAAIVDLPLADILGDIPRPPRRAAPFSAIAPPAASCPDIELSAACRAVLRHPTTACKRFLISIGDRTVGGLTARDQMVGPLQMPVSDCAAFFNDYEGVGGAAFALGERPEIAMLDPAAGARMAIAESLTNLAGAGIGELRRVKLSLNWLANCGEEDGGLRAAVRAASAFCIALQIGVVVGKDSLFMRARAGEGEVVESPPTPVAAAFAPHDDVGRILTPQICGGDSFLMIAEPSGMRRLGGGVFAEIFGAQDAPPDIAADETAAFWRAIGECHRRGLLRAYHDRSDGGLWACACEMAFAAGRGITLVLDPLLPAAQTDGGEVRGDMFSVAGRRQILTALFNEEIGALLEVAAADAAEVLQIFAAEGMAGRLQTAGRINGEKRMKIHRGGRKLLDFGIDDLRREWDAASYAVCRRRDDPQCAKEEHECADDGLFARLPEHFPADFRFPHIAKGGARSQIAVLREQGSNGQREMAAAFDRAGFAAADIAMSDLRARRRRLGEFAGIALCGGFSFGDVLGAGRGWAEGVLQNPMLSDMFAAFFADKNTFAFGACNGCQALALLQPLMPDADSWRFPHFAANRSGRFEARLAMAEILPSPSPLFAGMAGAMLPLVSSNAEGRAVWDGEMRAAAALRFVDGRGAPAESYPQNPAGGDGHCGFCSPDGGVTITMPHPERAFRCGQMSWHPPEWRGDASPWLQMFINARRFIG